MRLFWNKKTISLWLFLFPLAIQATNNTINSLPISLLPLVPRLSALDLVSPQVLGGDAMIPLLGNENDILYVDAQGKTAFNSDWLGSAGLGARFVQNNARILGAYVFADRNVSSQHQTFWLVSPGVESLGQRWDFRADGYIPVSAQQKLVGSGFASDFGNTSFVQFSGHNEYDMLVNDYQSVGWGLDGEVGRRVPGLKGMRAYVGSYHFNMSNADNINGVEGRLEYPLNRYLQLSMRESYDNSQHNTVELGLRVTLGGVNTSPRDPDQPIQERILDPIDRNLATLSNGSGVPISNEQQIINTTNPSNPNNPNVPPPPVLVRSDIWFFDENTSNSFVNATSCTANSPCAQSAFTQSTINSINGLGLSGNPLFYFRAGNYNALTNGLPDVLTDDSLSSRSNDWISVQRGAIFSGGFIVNGTRNNFSGIQLINDENFPQPQALSLTPGSQLVLDNSVIGVNNSSLTGYPTGVQLTDALLSVVNHSDVEAYTTVATPAVGIHATDTSGSTINVNNSTVGATAVGTFFNVNYAATGIAASGVGGTANINVQNGAQVSANGTRNFGNFILRGIDAAETTNAVTVGGGSTVSALGNVTFASQLMAQAVNLSGSTNTLQVNGGSQINAVANASQGNNSATFLTATAVQSTGLNNTLAIVGGSQLNATTSALNAVFGSAQGILINAEDQSTNQITLDNSTLTTNVNITNLSAGSGVNSVLAQGIFIDTTNVTTGASNTVTIANNSQLNISAFVNNADNNSGFSDQIVAKGIEIDGGDSGILAPNAQNTLNLDNSTLNVQATLATGATFLENTVATQGIIVATGDGGINTLVLNAAHVLANATITLGGENDQNMVNAVGINALAGNNATNQITVANASQLQANALLTTGGAFINQATASGLFAGAGTNGTNLITIGNSATDATSITGNAQISDGMASSNALNTVVAYGLNVYSTLPSAALNIIDVQGASLLNAVATLLNGSTMGGGANDATAEGILVSGGSNTTTLQNTSQINAAATSTGVASTDTAIGIESVAPLGPTNVVDNQVDPITNSNITALQNGVNNGQKIYQHP